MGEMISRCFPNLSETVFHSGMIRAQQTAELAFGNKSFKICPDLREINHGVTEGMSGEERNQMWRDFIPEAIREWESKNGSLKKFP